MEDKMRKLTVTRLSVSTLINDQRKNVIKYLESIDTGNILSKIIDRKKEFNKPIGKTNVKLLSNNDNKIELVVSFGFVYPYNFSRHSKDGHSLSSEYLLAANINCNMFLRDIDDISLINEKELLIPVFNKASQLSQTVTNDVLGFPAGIDFGNGAIKDN